MTPSLRDRLAPALAFLAVAIVAAIPIMLAPPLVHDSFWIDYVWAGRFHDELAAGHLYPRWLGGSFGGLGAPVFYFYAPLTFYATSIPIALGLGTYPALIATFVAFHAASGATMHRWLGGRGRAAFGGALLYMLLPYHLLDFARRGALAEFAAYALLPLLAIGVEKVETRRGFAALALAYAALIMTHLPTALLASVLLLPAQALRGGRRRRIVRAAAAALVGLMIASVYLLPALTLQRYGNMASMWAQAGYHPEAWSAIAPQRWPSYTAGLLFLALETALAVAALALWRGQRFFWPALAFVACMVAADVLPGFWSLPVLAKVQFPWRTLIIAEFAVATTFAQWLADPTRPRWAAYCLVPALAIGAPILLAAYPVGHPTLAELDRDRPEVPEYLPAGTAFSTSRQAEVLSRAIPAPVETAGWIVERRFWFPGTVVTCGGRALPSVAAPRTGLVAHRTAPGCTPVLSTGMLPVERLGWLISTLGLLAVSAIAGLPAWRRKRRGDG